MSNRAKESELNIRELLLYTVGIPLCYLLLLKLAGGVIGSLMERSDVRTLIGFAAVFGITAQIVYFFGRVIRNGEKHILTIPRFLFCFFYLGIPFIVMGIMHMIGFGLFGASPSVWFMAILTGLTPGICEELIFRGIVFNKASELLEGRRNSYLTAAVLSSAVFGLAHLANLSSQTLIPTLSQVYFAFAVGICYCGIYLFSGTLWIPILLHSIVDIGLNTSGYSEMMTTNTVDVTYLALTTVVLIEGLVLLAVWQRKMNKAQ